MKKCLFFSMIVASMLFAAMTSSWAASSKSGYVEAKKPIMMYSDPQKGIVVNAEQPQFTIRLKSNPTTGYRWFISGIDHDILHVQQVSYEPPQNAKMMGASGTQVWTFSVAPQALKGPYRTHLSFVYARPWEADKADQPLKATTFTISTP